LHENAIFTSVISFKNVVLFLHFFAKPVESWRGRRKSLPENCWQIVLSQNFCAKKQNVRFTKIMEQNLKRKVDILSTRIFFCRTFAVCVKIATSYPAYFFTLRALRF